jgi:hypothetical protein
VTHVDADHIAGVLKIFATPQLGLKIKEVWFNGYQHLLEPGEPFGPKQGENLTAGITAAGIPWNEQFGGKAVKVPDTGALPVGKCEGGLELVVLGPTMAKLRLLKPVWIDECKAAGIKPGKPARTPAPPGVESFGPISVPLLADQRFEEDPTEANGSSIVLLLRYKGTQILLGADGHPSVIEAGLKRFSPRSPVKLAAYKVAHHGSRNNVSQSMLEQIDCARYLFSSNGAIYHHPGQEAIARILKYGKRGAGPVELVFNYRTQYNEVWDAPSLKRQWSYTTEYPAAGEAGIVAFQK